MVGSVSHDGKTLYNGAGTHICTVEGNQILDGAGGALGACLFIAEKSTREELRDDLSNDLLSCVQAASVRTATTLTLPAPT